MDLSSFFEHLPKEMDTNINNQLPTEGDYELLLKSINAGFSKSKKPFIEFKLEIVDEGEYAGYVFTHVYWLTENNKKYIARDFSFIFKTDITDLKMIATYELKDLTFKAFLHHNEFNGIKNLAIKYIVKDQSNTDLGEQK